jgi:DNA-binding beta-propeller fold protein YncE
MTRRERHQPSSTHPTTRVIGVFLGSAVLASLGLAAGRIGLEPRVEANQQVDGRHDDDRHHKDDKRGSVWVLNRDLGELTIFDARSGRPVRRLGVGAGAHDICISEHARKAYITAETVNQVTVVDTRTLEVEVIDVGPLPHHIEPSADGKTIYVSLASHSPAVGAPQYAAIATSDNSVTYVTTSSNPLARSHGPRPSPDGQTVYVAHDTGDELTAIDTPTGTIDFSLGPILRAEEAVTNRFGTFLWVSSRGDNTVKRIKIGRNAITASIPVGVQPESVLLTPSEQTLVVSLRGTPAAVAFVDTAALALEKLVPIGGAGTFGDLAVMTPDGRYVYATFDAGTTGKGGVAVIHVPTRRVVATWPYPDTGRPHGIWYTETRVDRH